MTISETNYNYRNSKPNGYTGNDHSKNMPQYVVDRPAVTQGNFDKNYALQEPTPKGCCDEVLEFFKYECSRERLIRGLKARLPFIDIARSYKKEWLVSDIISGITIGVLQIPLGMGYILLASLPPVIGLYMAFYSVILYAFLGTSQHISHGTFAVASLVMRGAIERLGIPPAHGSGGHDSLHEVVLNATAVAFGVSEGSGEISGITSTMSTMGHKNVYTRVQVATVLCLMSGIIQTVFGFLRLGNLNVYLPDVLVSAFTTGAAVLVFTSQFGALFGLKVPHFPSPFEIVQTYTHIFTNIDQANWLAIVISVVTITILVLGGHFINANTLAKWKVPFPTELFMIIIGTAISYYMQLNVTYKISIVGEIPKGLPPFEVPPIMPLFKELIGDAFAVAIIAYVLSLSVAKIMAKKHQYDINANQEFIAMGISNIFASFFSCASTCVSLSRVMVQDQVGGKTNLTALISAVLMLFILLVIAPLFESLPSCVLASIIVVAIKKMFLQFGDLVFAWRTSKYEALIWLSTFISVTFISIQIGLCIGVSVTILCVVWRSQMPYMALLGHISGTALYMDVNRYQTAKEIPGVKIFHFGAPLIFANAKTFRKELYRIIGLNPQSVFIANEKKRKLEIKQKKVQKISVTNEKDSGSKSGVTSYNVSSNNLNHFDPRYNGSNTTLYNNSPVNHRVLGHANPVFEVDSGIEQNSAQYPSSTEQSPTGTPTPRMRKESSQSIAINIESKHLERRASMLVLQERERNLITQPERRLSHISLVCKYFSNSDIRVIILDFSAISFIDSSGISNLLQVINEYKKINIEVFIAACTNSVSEMLQVSGFHDQVPTEIVYPTIHDAVLHALLLDIFPDVNVMPDVSAIAPRSSRF